MKGIQKKQNKANTNICNSLQPKSFCHWKWLFHVSAFPGALGSAAAILSIGHYRLLSHSVCIQNEISCWILFIDICWFGLSVLIVVPEMRSTLGVSVNCIMLLHSLTTMKRHSSVHSWGNVFFQPPTEFKHICDSGSDYQEMIYPSEYLTTWVCFCTCGFEITVSFTCPSNKQ